MDLLANEVVIYAVSVIVAVIPENMQQKCLNCLVNLPMYTVTHSKQMQSQNTMEWSNNSVGLHICTAAICNRFANVRQIAWIDWMDLQPQCQTILNLNSSHLWSRHRGKILSLTKDRLSASVLVDSYTIVINCTVLSRLLFHFVKVLIPLHITF